MDDWWRPMPPGVLRDKPWLHQTAIDYLESILTPEMSVIEQGCGGSTLWIASRVKWMLSFETDPAWHKAVQALAPANCHVYLLPDENTFPALAHSFDLAFIDGARMGRKVWLSRAREYAKQWVVLDNANRPEYAQERDALAGWCELKARFDNNIPAPFHSLYFVTEFWRVRE